MVNVIMKVLGHHMIATVTSKKASWIVLQMITDEPQKQGKLMNTFRE